MKPNYSLLTKVCSCGLALALVLTPFATEAPRSARAATFTVTTINDSGPGSLRQAILDANAAPGLDTLAFAIGAPGSQQTIALTTALPAITGPVSLDGWSQGGAGYAGPPLIEINGSGITSWNVVSGLLIIGGGSTVRGLAVNYFNIAIDLTTVGSNVIAGNYLGLALDGSTPIGNRTGLRIVSTSDNNRIGTDGDGVNDAAERNVISASGYVQQNNSTGILIDQGSDNNWIAGNYIGTDAAGTQDRGNASNGITTGGVTLIGTNGDGVGDALEGNLISGNNGHGVALSTTSNGSRVAGNRVGTDLTGTAAIPNNSNGVSVGSCSPGQCSNYIIGTNGDGVSDTLEGNLISGNGAAGVFIPSGTLSNNVVAGNKIGTNAAGTAALPNGDYGVHLGGDFSRLGTNNDGVSDALEGNLISGNGDGAGNNNHGVVIPGGADHNLVAGNRIGVNLSGTAALPNGQTGLRVEDASNIIAGNLISGNGEHGLYLYDAFSNTVTGNVIGAALDGVTPLGNTQHGVSISINSDDNVIGGANPGEGNAIAFNGGDGVFVDGGINCGAAFCLRNRIVGNDIFENAGLGIDLYPNGVTANDPNDGDSGANALQNFPVIASVSNTSGVLTATGMLSSTANQTFTLHFYSNAACDPAGYGEGQTFLGALTTTTDLSGTVAFTATLPVSVPEGQLITATATDPDGNTSEFSACSAPTGYAPISGLQAFNNSPTYLGASTQLSASVAGGSGVSFAWAFGDGQMGSGAVVAHAYAAVGVYTAIVTATNTGSSASASTVVTVTPPPPCAATADDGLTVFTSNDALAARQAVVDANANDTVKVAGTCAGVSAQNGVTQTVYLDKPLTLRGGYAVFDWSASYPLTRPTTLDAQGMGRVLFITNSVPVTLETLIIANGFISGTAPACPDYGCGGGLYTNGALTVNQVQVLTNSARRAGGMYVLGPLEALDTAWVNNTGLSQRGGAFEVYGDAALTGGLVQGNAAAYAGGIFADAGLTISGTHFISNTATSPVSGSGGAAYAAGPLSIVNALFQGNQAHTGGGAVLHSPGAPAESMAITNSVFISNTALHAAAQGGALYAANGTIHASTFQGNSAPGSSGAGGAIVAFQAMILTSVSLISNTAGAQGGALYHWGLSESGNTSQIHPLVISNTVLSGNSAGTEGGALYFRRGFAASNVPVQLQQAAFLNNTAVLSGGAAFLGQPAVITRSEFRHNASSASGGGLLAQDELILEGAAFYHNSSATNGGGLALVDQPGSTSRILNSLFADNQAGGNGAGIFIAAGGAVEIAHTTLAGTGLASAQAVYATTGSVNITNTIVASHTVGLERGGTATVTAHHNLFFGNTTNTGGGAVNTDPLGGDPRFIDPPEDDYHLSLDSAALDTGLNLGLATDFEDDLRHIGAAVDVGADEFGDAALISGSQATQLQVRPRPGQQISITIPPGAGGGAGVIRLAPIVTPTRPLPPGRQYANFSFDLRIGPGIPAGIATLSALTFPAPILIEVQYTDADVADANEAALELWVWDEGAQQWIRAVDSCAAPGLTVRRTEPNTLIVPVCGEGEFALASWPHQLHLPLIRRP